jgi:hypothetical protein
MSSECGNLTKDEAYARGYDCGFNGGFIAGVQSGYAQGVDDTTRTMIKEAGF